MDAGQVSSLSGLALPPSADDSLQRPAMTSPDVCALSEPVLHALLAPEARSLHCLVLRWAPHAGRTVGQPLFRSMLSGLVSIRCRRPHDEQS